MNPYRLRAYILLIIVSLIWAVAGPIIKFTLGALAPLPFLIYRFALSSICGLIILLLTKITIPKDKKTILLIFVYGLFTSSITLGLLFWGLEKTTVTDMSLISITGPLLITVAGVIFLREHVTRREKVGMAVAVSGMLITVVEPLIVGNGLNQLSGNILIIFYLIGNTFSIVLLKILLKSGVRPSVLSNLSFIIGFLTLLPLALIKYNFNGLISTYYGLPLLYHLAIIFMALISGNLAYSLSHKAHKSIEISEAALFSYLYPILSIPLAVIWLKEKITLQYIIGAAVILIGVIIAEFRKTAQN